MTGNSFGSPQSTCEQGCGAPVGQGGTCGRCGREVRAYMNEHQLERPFRLIDDEPWMWTAATTTTTKGRVA